MATLVLQVPDESLVSKVKQACNMGMPAMYPTSQAMHMGKPRDVPHRERYSNSIVY